MTKKLVGIKFDAEEEPNKVEVSDNSVESESDKSLDGEHAVQERGRDRTRGGRARGCGRAPGLGQATRRGLGRRDNIVPPVANHDEMIGKNGKVGKMHLYHHVTL